MPKPHQIIDVSHTGHNADEAKKRLLGWLEQFGFISKPTCRWFGILPRDEKREVENKIGGELWERFPQQMHSIFPDCPNGLPQTLCRPTNNEASEKKYLERLYKKIQDERSGLGRFELYKGNKMVAAIMGSSSAFQNFITQLGFSTEAWFDRIQIVQPDNLWKEVVVAETKPQNTDTLMSSVEGPEPQTDCLPNSVENNMNDLEEWLSWGQKMVSALQSTILFLILHLAVWSQPMPAKVSGGHIDIAPCIEIAQIQLQQEPKIPIANCLPAKVEGINSTDGS